MQSPLRARRALPPMIALGLAASALTMGGSAQADAVVDVSGNVTKAVGGALGNVLVTAQVQNGNQFVTIETTGTDAAGNYSFTDLDAATRAANYPGTTPEDVAVRNATSVKVYFSGGVPVGEQRTNPGYLGRAFGGTKSLTNSPAVPINGAPVIVNQALPSAAGVIVRVTGPTGAPVTNFGSATLFEAGSTDPLDAAVTTFDTTDDDPFDNPATPVDESANQPVDGLVYVSGLEPGSYAVRGSGSDFDDATDVFRSYLPRFLGGDGTYAKATPITAVAGTFAGTGVQLTDVLTPTQSPRIIGDSSFGSTLVADPGTWLRQQGTEFTYSWIRKGAVVSTAPTYKLSKADKKQKISLVVRAVNGPGFTEFVGAAAAAPTSKVGEKSKVKAKRDGYGFDVSVKVAKKKLARKLGTPKGKVALYTEDGELASKKAKLKGGKVNDLTPKRAFLSETKYTVVYLGGGKLGSDSGTAKAGKGGGGKKKK